MCKDTIVGDEMQRGISGGQKKRVTTGIYITTNKKTKSKSSSLKT
jgi:hypothetical protein